VEDFSEVRELTKGVKASFNFYGITDGESKYFLEINIK
jgi:hypothetical protein